MDEQQVKEKQNHDRTIKSYCHVSCLLMQIDHLLQMFLDLPPFLVNFVLHRQCNIERIPRRWHDSVCHSVRDPQILHGGDPKLSSQVAAPFESR